MNAWQTIDSAPKDGTRVLVFRAKWAENMFVAWFNTETGDWAPLLSPYIGLRDVTHWMPLPEPPK